MSDSRERSADAIDHAAQMSEDMLNADIKTARAKVAPEQHPNFDGVHCVEENCGIELPKARLEMGRVRCVECQVRLEAVAKRGAR